MDNSKTGTLIRACRKELNLTQRDLAERLHVTDRAVSKWERGLCAPDIGLLEPLAEILNVSVVELLEGERQKRRAEDGAEERARTVLRYSGDYPKGQAHAENIQEDSACGFGVSCGGRLETLSQWFAFCDRPDPVTRWNVRGSCI